MVVEGGPSLNIERMVFDTVGHAHKRPQQDIVRDLVQRRWQSGNNQTRNISDDIKENITKISTKREMLNIVSC